MSLAQCLTISMKQPQKKNWNVKVNFIYFCLFFWHSRYHWAIKSAHFDVLWCKETVFRITIKVFKCFATRIRWRVHRLALIGILRVWFFFVLPPAWHTLNHEQKHVWTNIFQIISSNFRGWKQTSTIKWKVISCLMIAALRFTAFYIFGNFFSSSFLSLWNIFLLFICSSPLKTSIVLPREVDC